VGVIKTNSVKKAIDENKAERARAMNRLDLLRKRTKEEILMSLQGHI
jgi:hypothetical protein